MNPLVDQYLTEGCGRCALGGTPDCKVHEWTEELVLLRSIILDTGLTEEHKWRVPTYTHQGSNILIMSALKERCSVGFFKGVLLKDELKLLDAPGPNSQAVRQFNFTSVQEIEKATSDIKAYVNEAIEIEKAGLKVPFKKSIEDMPEELLSKFEEDPVFKTAFESLTPGRQRGYLIHFSQPKQSKTRATRIEKWLPKIINGEGMHDAYQKMKK